jgi:hypothetical protein
VHSAAKGDNTPELTKTRINLRHLSKTLEALGYDYVLCNNGKEALDNFTRPESDIDAVIIVSKLSICSSAEIATNPSLGHAYARNGRPRSNKPNAPARKVSPE